MIALLELGRTKVQKESGNIKITYTEDRVHKGAYYEAQSGIDSRTFLQKITKKKYPINVIYQDSGLAGQILSGSTPFDATSHRRAVKKKWRQIKRERNDAINGTVEKPVHLMRG